MVCKFFDEKTSGSSIKNEIFLIKNYLKNYTNQLPIIRNFNKRKD